MMKLLHERLRDWEDNGDGTVSVAGIGTEIRTTRSAMENMAYEIEKYYIPRPRFEDGEPVQFGDEAQNENGGSDRVYIMTFYGNGSTLLFDGIPMDICELDEGEFVKRPEATDTLERIEDDATIMPYAYCLKHGIKLSDAPDMEEATIAMVHDLLRRQREVLRCDQSS